MITDHDNHIDYESLVKRDKALLAHRPLAKLAAVTPEQAVEIKDEVSQLKNFMNDPQTTPSSKLRHAFYFLKKLFEVSDDDEINKLCRPFGMNMIQPFPVEDIDLILEVSFGLWMASTCDIGHCIGFTDDQLKEMPRLQSAFMQAFKMNKSVRSVSTKPLFAFNEEVFGYAKKHD